jgi:hypothetical protein
MIAASLLLRASRVSTDRLTKPKRRPVTIPRHATLH